METLQKIGLNQIQVTGFFRNLLRLQANGLTGHMEEIFPDVGSNSAWLGNIGESWERGPYYIDGLFSLAYALFDPELIKKSQKWIDSIIKSQESNGNFGPKSNLDWWPRFVVIKAMTNLFLATNDEMIFTFIQKYLDYIYQEIDDFPLELWAYARGMEGFEAIELIYKRTKNDKYLKLLKKLQNYTLNWEEFFDNFPYPEPTDKYLNRSFFNMLKPVLAMMDKHNKTNKCPKKKTKEEINKANNSKVNQIYLKTHGVNLAMSLKYLAYNSYLSDSKNKTDKVFPALKKLLAYHGTATDLFSSDEHLNGFLPDKGIELCSVVEMMYSMEEIMRINRSPIAADYLETYLYSALPAMFSKDLCSHQYVQQTNQISATNAKRDFFDTNNLANTFGIAPNYGCCATNLHQGFPKALASAVLTSTNSIYFFLFISGKYTISLYDGAIILDVQTNYPFSNTITIRCLENTISKPFKILIRRPFQADTTILVNQVKYAVKEEQSMLIFDRTFTANDVINIKFDMKIHAVNNNDGTVSFRKGPIVFVNRLIEKESPINSIDPLFYDREYRSESDFHLAPLLHKNNLQIIEEKAIIGQNDKSIFDYGIELRVKAVHVKNWKIHHNSLQNVSNPKIMNGVSEMVLSPYGNSILRVTHFPIIEDDL